MAQLQKVNKQQSLHLVLPNFKTSNKASSSTAKTLRVLLDGSEVLGSIPDYLQWLGVDEKEDAKGDDASWQLWLRSELCYRQQNMSQGVRIVYIFQQVAGQRQKLIPFTNFAGFHLITKICLRNSKIAQNTYDEVFKVLGQQWHFHHHPPVAPEDTTTTVRCSFKRCMAKVLKMCWVGMSRTQCWRRRNAQSI